MVVTSFLGGLGPPPVRRRNLGRQYRAQLVLLQLQLEHPQQLDVLQEEQLDVLVLELHQSAASCPTSAISSTSKVAASRSSSSRPSV